MTSTVLGLQGHILDHQALLPHKQLPGEELELMGGLPLPAAGTWTPEA